MKNLIVTFFVCTAAGAAHANAVEKVIFGRFASRAIYTSAAACPAPAVILLPGSGPNGPEEMMPGSITGDGKPHSIFASFSAPFVDNGVHTLAVGKPGIDFFTSFDKRFYDEELYDRLRWSELQENLSDAIAYVKSQPCVDPSRIYVLGHSEGTVVAVDYLSAHPGSARGTILIGYSGESLATTVDWQIFRRSIDLFFIPDVDKNGDSHIDQAEAAAWPEFVHLDWSSGKSSYSIAEIEALNRADQKAIKAMEAAKSLEIWKGVFDREPLYQKTASLAEDVFIFTGAFDVQTRPEEALKAGEACRAVGKANCEVTIVPGLGHAMSKPRGPRGHQLLDATLGPVDGTFRAQLAELARRIAK